MLIGETKGKYWLIFFFSSECGSILESNLFDSIATSLGGAQLSNGLVMSVFSIKVLRLSHFLANIENELHNGLLC